MTVLLRPAWLAIGVLVAGAASADEAFLNTDVFELEVAANPQISPDGSRIAYVRRSNDISEQYCQALKLRKIDTALIRVPEAPHGIAGRPSHLIAKADNILAWFPRYRDE